MTIIEWLKKNKNHATLWQCKNCNSFRATPEKPCICDKPNADSEERKLYTTNDIEKAIKKCAKRIK